MLAWISSDCGPWYVSRWLRDNRSISCLPFSQITPLVHFILLYFFAGGGNFFCFYFSFILTILNLSYNQHCVDRKCSLNSDKWNKWEVFQLLFWCDVDGGGCDWVFSVNTCHNTHIGALTFSIHCVIEITIPCMKIFTQSHKCKFKMSQQRHPAETTKKL